MPPPPDDIAGAPASQAPSASAAPPPAEGSRWPRHLQLFIATVASVFYMGMDPDGAWWKRSLSNLSVAHGLMFAGSLLVILVAHESGHYIAARLHKVEASLPYFIPMPVVSPFGTMGAVIRMSGVIRTRAALLDIGAAGPLAGLVFAIPLYLWGTAHPHFIPGDGSHDDLMTLGDSLLSRLLDHFVAPPVPDGMIVMSSPIAFGAWAGLFVTMINLIPVGQLDGGHVAYALFGPRQDRYAAFIHRAMLVFALVSLVSYVGRDVRAGLGLHHLGQAVNNSLFWLVWFEVLAVLGTFSARAQGGAAARAAREALPLRTRALATIGLALLASFGRDHSSVLLWIGWFGGLGILLAMEARFGVLRAHSLLDHPPTGAAPLGRGRVIVAVITLAFFVLLFMPTPISL
jgi:Zn-dependent protease